LEADPTAFDGVYEGQSGPAGGFCDTPTEAARLVVRGGMARFARVSYGQLLRYKPQRVEQDGTLQVTGPTYKINGAFKGGRFSGNGIQISGMPCNLYIVLTKTR